MTRLRRVTVSGPGISRRRAGTGFSYRGPSGERITDPEVIARCRALVIPPAWEQVWICPAPNGHIQAYGLDAAGRGQYIYHEQWRARRDRAKYAHALDVGSRLPRMRASVTRDLVLSGMPRERALALALRLLDVGSFRLGTETYTRANDSHGLATLLREHVSLVGAADDGTTAANEAVRLRFPAKSGKDQDVTVVDLAVREAVQVLLSRRGGLDGEAGGSAGTLDRLLAWRDPGPPVRWHALSSAEISAEVKDRLGTDASAKDFRTWHATVRAALVFAEAGSPPQGRRARRAVVAEVVREVAALLGNTPAVARASYIDPRVIDLWEHGTTIPVVRSRSAAETAVLRLLTG